MGSEDRGRLESSLQRIEELVSGLSVMQDPVAREHARELMESILDLHGLAMARIVAEVAQTEGGAELLRRLGRNEQVSAVLLLHGLHPEELDTRVRQAIQALQPPMRDQHIRIVLQGISPAAVNLRILRGGECKTPPAELRQQIEGAILEAAPDLDTIDMQFEDEGVRQPVHMAAPAAVVSC